ncbi:MAG: sspH [Firmicutes bacterium]|nr:sspH [Bacillota bacterium]
MNASRAEEIIKSTDIIGVQFQSNYVWIEEVDKERNTAQVTYLENPHTIDVDIDQLVEIRAVNKQH